MYYYLAPSFSPIAQISTDVPPLQSSHHSPHNRQKCCTNPHLSRRIHTPRLRRRAARCSTRARRRCCLRCRAFRFAISIRSPKSTRKSSRIQHRSTYLSCHRCLIPYCLMPHSCLTQSLSEPLWRNSQPPCSRERTRRWTRGGRRRRCLES
jgi:hypothetical protein